MENAFQPLPDPTNPGASPSPTSPSFIRKLLANKTVLIFSGIGLLILFGLGTYILISPSQKKTEVSLDTTPVTETSEAQSTPTISHTTISPTINPIAQWKSYSNALYGYTIKYPPDWIARDLGSIEPKIPSYIVFNPTTASQSARFITISVSTRTYDEQLALGSAGSIVTVATIVGTKQSFQDSDNSTSTAIILPRTNTLLVLRTKTPYLTIFNQMISTLQITK